MGSQLIKTTTSVKNDVGTGLVEFTYDEDEVGGSSMPVAVDQSSSMPVAADESSSMPVAVDKSSSMPVAANAGNLMPITANNNSSTPVVPDGAERQFEIT